MDEEVAMKRCITFAICAALGVALASAPASAHEAGDRALGTVASVTAERLVVRARDGHEVAFRLTGETRITRGDKPAKAADVRVGERAVVHGRPAGGEVEAVRVKLGTGKR
jgi:hypothetical protein